VPGPSVGCLAPGLLPIPIMDAIDILTNEHRLIGRVLDALVGFAGKVRSGPAPDERAELGRFVTFIREFADEHHHAKEEDMLFAALVEHGFPAHAGPIAVMLAEHEEGRVLVRRLRDRAGSGAAWGAAQREGVLSSAHAYADLLRAHIHGEDGILFPMARQHLPPEAMAVVAEACARADREHAERGVELVALAGELTRAHGSG